MNYFVILAAGKGNRFISKIPKQYINYNGKKMIFHSIDKAIQSKLFNKIVLVIRPKDKKYLKELKNKKIKIINGGKERMDSSLKSLNFIKKFNPKKVFIHDAARPDFSVKLLKKLNTKIKNGCISIKVQEKRTQFQNRQLALHKLRSLLKEIIMSKEKIRKVTKPTQSSQRKRIEEKKKRGEIKRNRNNKLNKDL